MRILIAEDEKDLNQLIRKRLKDAGFDGACLIEVYSSCYSGFGEIKESLDYLNDIKESL